MKRQIDNAFFSYRRLNLAGLLLTGSALAYASIVLEEQLNAVNCSLCTIVRLCLLCMSALFFLAFIHNPSTFGQRVYGLLNWLLSIAGIITTGRYIWLESQPADASLLCNTGLEAWTEKLPFLPDVLLANQNECLSITWQFMGLSLSQVTAGLFILLFLITWRLLIRRPIPKLFF
ncbi:disulfide bond formation protein B [Neptunomonas antarctica]|uniref:Thiol:disulfide interchange protein DsbB n=1 Tax=Neptunomonas antarctica TaxID=619304 RepID=A0A1N7NQ73_9GAMM|nr:disulfide bond formation protein B [Neptunomonas antarctica]SIT00543.1 Thiol:disulfide interchange protein DsbB [Neptunomonas antarctica]